MMEYFINQRWLDIYTLLSFNPQSVSRPEMDHFVLWPIIAVTIYTYLSTIWKRLHKTPIKRQSGWSLADRLRRTRLIKHTRSYSRIGQSTYKYEQSEHQTGVVLHSILIWVMSEPLWNSTDGLMTVMKVVRHSFGLRQSNQQPWDSGLKDDPSKNRSLKESTFRELSTQIHDIAVFERPKDI